MSIRAAAAIGLGVIGFVAGPAFGQERVKLQYNHVGQTSKYLAQQAYDVGDQPGHQVRIYRVQRTYGPESTLVIRGVRVKSSEANGYSDYTNGIGPIWGLQRV